jgi:hypothetical protein
MKLKLKDGAAVDPESGEIFSLRKKKKNSHLDFILKDLKRLVMFSKIQTMVEYLLLFLVLLI